MLELFEQYKITKPIRLIELFAGYGSQALALENLGVKFEHHQVIEFDKYAIASYNALHGTKFDTIDITQLKTLDIADTDKYDYILTYSFPCTDLSLAGKQLGMKKGTRSGLLWEVERLLKNTKELPQVLVMENVTQVHGFKHKEDFNEWISFLAKLGYSNQWQDLNAKHYGIPQNRDRTFMVSILGDYEYHFPKPIELKLRLKDMLEDNVNEKYYLSDKMIEQISNWNAQQDPLKDIDKEKEISPTLTARGAGETHSGMVLVKDKPIVVGSVDIGNNESNNRVYDSEGLSPTLNTMQGGHRQPKILLDKIRKLTPTECLRLMGLNNNQIKRIKQSNNSNAQLYKQAGNSIVVQVLEAIFKNLLHSNF